MREPVEPFVDDLAELDPVISTEVTDNGWRGLTEEGQVLEVSGTNGHKISIPTEILIHHNGTPIGRRKVGNEWDVNIGHYLVAFNRAVAFYKHNQLTEALAEADATLLYAPTLRAKFNHSMILLASARWRNGLAEYVRCEEHAPFMRPQVKQALAAGMTPWQGEDPRGKRLLVIHAHGFGDTIQCLRYVPVLKAMGADVRLMVPPELASLAVLFAPLADTFDADYFCPILHLLKFLDVQPFNVDPRPYIKIPMSEWRRGRTKIGLAWSVGKPSPGDYPRTIELRELRTRFGPDSELHSVQTQGADEAVRLGVIPHQFADFGQCAELMMTMDAIVSVDTAALHLAGAIGHPQVFGLLSHWHSWRWVANWYS